MDCDADADDFSWDYIKQVPSATSIRLSRDVFRRPQVESVRSSLDQTNYDFDNDMPVTTRRSKQCGEIGGINSSTSGRSFPSNCSMSTTHS